MELISKIEKLTSVPNAKKLHRQVYVSNRVKTFNETIYYNVDKIHEAIAANKQITFKYFEMNVDKKKVYRKNGDLYTESPVALSWDDENYYLITYKQKYDSYTHYRVDKMESIEITDDDRVLKDESFDLSEYSKATFGMFGGEETNVSIKFENELVGVVLDRFGSDVRIVKADEKHFICSVNVAVSPHFLAWLFSFGNRAEIISPDYVIDEMYSLILDVKEKYDSK
jgi:predicted DNA-binding transcriptional regulator YafY